MGDKITRKIYNIKNFLEGIKEIPKQKKLKIFQKLEEIADAESVLVDKIDSLTIANNKLIDSNLVFEKQLEDLNALNAELIDARDIANRTNLELTSQVEI